MLFDSFPKIKKRPAPHCHKDRLTQGVKRPQERSHIPQDAVSSTDKIHFLQKTMLSLTDLCASPKTSACITHDSMRLVQAVIM